MNHCFRLFAFFFATLLGIFAFCGVTNAANRKALIIGNAAYDFAPLRNPINDAEDMADALQAAGFSVTLVRNASQQQMNQAVNQFAAKLTRKDIALFYFSGHGVQIDGRNYLVPLGVKLASQSDAKEQSVDLAHAIEALTGSGAAASILIMDACRNNPLPVATRSLSRGLARQISTATGTFISFSTSPGAVALDGIGRNSPYTKNLVTALKMPGLNLEETFKRTLKAVHEETKGVQTPWISSSFFGSFTFVAAGKANMDTQSVVIAQDTQAKETNSGNASRQHSETTKKTPPLVVEGTYEVRGTNPDGGRYRGEAYLSRIGDSWRFEWLIAGQTFVGIGEFINGKLSIEWGDSNPVVYEIPESGVLDGRWGANGKGTDILVLKAPASLTSKTPDHQVNLVGKYNANGRNPDGSRYKGRVVISHDGDTYYFQWWIGQQTYRGRGKLVQNILTIDWGETDPVIYQVMANGSLKGTWAAGKAIENLTKR
ncbi:MAG: caspase family protein [Planctomycetaceae bacterium]|nr:caspase family protein [Planctomycetaceae bacterium]